MKLTKVACFCLGILAALLAVGLGYSLRRERTPMSEAEVIRQFNMLYYAKLDNTWGAMKWFGVPAQKYPTDMWIYQEIMYELKPDLIIEAGTYRGGSALYLAHLCDQLGKGKVVTFDILDHQPRPTHPRIEYFIASSTSKHAEDIVRSHIQPGDTVMVVLDSDHRKNHVLDELKLYNGYVTRGSYLIVEDTNINGNPVAADFGPGPMEAVNQFLQGNSQFEVDSSRERLMLTANPRGYLKRVR